MQTLSHAIWIQHCGDQRLSLDTQSPDKDPENTLRGSNFALDRDKGMRI